jgi:putative aminopeptidase FrvX
MSAYHKRTRTRLLRKLLAVQSLYGKEDRMVAFLVEHCRREGYTVTTDKHRNVYVTKGQADHYPTVAAHIDTVQPIRENVRIAVSTFDKQGNAETLIGFHVNGDGKEHQVGVGGDCKTGVFVCLELLRHMPVLKVAFMAGEEIGCHGARMSDPDWFRSVGYCIEFDCPSKNLMSYTSSGIRLFDNNGEFIKTALPTLQKYGVKWQAHPFTDVSVLRPMHGMSCMNLASGYYRWHADTEYVFIPDVKNAIVMAQELISALGERYYPFMNEEAEPLVSVSRLEVNEPSHLRSERPRLV